MRWASKKNGSATNTVSDQSWPNGVERFHEWNAARFIQRFVGSSAVQSSEKNDMLDLINRSDCYQKRILVLSNEWLPNMYQLKRTSPIGKHEKQILKNACTVNDRSSVRNARDTPRKTGHKGWQLYYPLWSNALCNSSCTFTDFSELQQTNT